MIGLNRVRLIIKISIGGKFYIDSLIVKTRLYK
jgi:hypothetical protein